LLRLLLLLGYCPFLLLYGLFCEVTKCTSRRLLSACWLLRLLLLLLLLLLLQLGYCPFML
jgi:hypothetical protein